jgi:hypothetical protein
MYKTFPWFPPLVKKPNSLEQCYAALRTDTQAVKPVISKASRFSLGGLTVQVLETMNQWDDINGNANWSIATKRQFMEQVIRTDASIRVFMEALWTQIQKEHNVHRPNFDRFEIYIWSKWLTCKMVTLRNRNVYKRGKTEISLVEVATGSGNPLVANDIASSVGHTSPLRTSPSPPPTFMSPISTAPHTPLLVPFFDPSLAISPLDVISLAMQVDDTPEICTEYPPTPRLRPVEFSAVEDNSTMVSCLSTSRALAQKSEQNPREFEHKGRDAASILEFLDKSIESGTIRPEEIIEYADGLRGRFRRSDEA